MTTIASDPFTRVTAAGLGVEPVTGQTWQATGTAADYSTTGTLARIATVTINALYYALINTGAADHIISHTFTVPVVPATAGVTLRLVCRYTDASNFYEAQLLIAATTGATTLLVQKRVAGVLTTVASSASVGTHAAGNSWRCDIQVFGNTVRARAWNTTGAAVTTWTHSNTDTSGNTPPTTGMLGGFGTRRETGNTNGTINIDGDNFIASTLITVIQQDVYPPRLQVTVNGLQVGDVVSLYRSVAGVRTLVQNGSATTTDVVLIRVDAELPFGVALLYVAVINGEATSSVAATYALPGGKVVASDAITALAAEVVILAWPEKLHSRSATVFRPAGRNVVVLGPLSDPSADVELYTDAASSAENLLELLEFATQGIIQIRQPGGYGGVDGFYSVLSYRERRWSQDGSDEKRVHVLSLVQVDGWAAVLSALGFTYADLATTYTGLTYANVGADFATYLLLSQGDFS